MKDQISIDNHNASSPEPKNNKNAFYIKLLGIVVGILTVISILLNIGYMWGESANGEARTVLQGSLDTTEEALKNLKAQNNKTQISLVNANDSINRLLFQIDTLHTHYNTLTQVINDHEQSLDSVTTLTRKKEQGLTTSKANTSHQDHPNTTSSNSPPRPVGSKPDFSTPVFSTGFVKLASFDKINNEFFGISIITNKELSIASLDSLSDYIQIKSGSLVFSERPKGPYDEFKYSSKSVEILDSKVTAKIISNVYQIEKNGIIQFWIKISK